MCVCLYYREYVVVLFAVGAEDSSVAEFGLGEQRWRGSFIL